jgi:6-phosphogluconolactonase
LNRADAARIWGMDRQTLRERFIGSRRPVRSSIPGPILCSLGTFLSRLASWSRDYYHLSSHAGRGIRTSVYNYSSEERLGARRSFVFVGGCNRPTPYFASANSRGISCFAFDEDSAKCIPLSVTEGVDNPTFLAADPAGRRLYAGSEVHGWNEGTVSAYDINLSTGELFYINKQPTRGSTVAQFSFDRTGRFLLLVNYAAIATSQRPDRSLVVFPIANGEIGSAAADARHSGSSVNVDRQERSHAHAVLASPDNRFLLVSDLGLDKIIVYRFDSARGAIERSSELDLPPGAGPRHFVFHPQFPLVYLSNELSSTVATLGYDAGTGELSLLDVTPTVPEAARRQNACAEICFGPGARWLYVSNRGHDSLSAMAVDSETGRLLPLGAAPSGGKTPRHFALDPSGRFFVVANQDSDNLSIFEIDQANGSLKLVSSVAVGTPTSVCFVRASL